MTQTLDDAAESFVGWLHERVMAASTGENVSQLELEPSGSFWLGRLAPEDAVVQRGLGERGERLDPCASGMRLLVHGDGAHAFSVLVRCRVWLRKEKDLWLKSSPVDVSIKAVVPDAVAGVFEVGQAELTEALTHAAGTAGMSAVLRLELRSAGESGRELTVLVVNSSPSTHVDLADTNLYEVGLEVVGLATKPFLLAALPDSFRINREVAAYGVNCGVDSIAADHFRTTDCVVADRGRPTYWAVATEAPDLSFATLQDDPLPSLEALARDLAAWGHESWSESKLADRAIRESWSAETAAGARSESAIFMQELRRVEAGFALLRSDEQVRIAFTMMNEALQHAAHGRYAGWRPFQIGFLLANLACLVDHDAEASVVDIIWFATGGGKTETYLGLLVMAAFLDRMHGKGSGITAWSRFPLRMLSLQQTQRFADAMAGAELVRRRQGIPGEPFSVGFFVGQGGTPNRISTQPDRDGDPDPDDDDMPARYQVLLTCPFCHLPQVEMGFDRATWCLEHRCTNTACPWEPRRLPFFIVDDEIFRFLPTVVVGTLDKAASIALQASMRGFVGPPHGLCTREGHGFTYASRSSRPHGCLVPGCPGPSEPIDSSRREFGPAFRLQDELHLLRDSLGAVDSHYEGLLDHLQEVLTGRRPKILASSATLTGYQNQTEVVYARSGRVFPTPGPSPEGSFWSRETDRLARRFVAIAPRGQTVEFAVDQLLTVLQGAIRRLRSEPQVVCEEAGVDPVHAHELLSLYGTDVVYGNTLRDLDAVLRSAETQVQVDGQLNTATLTGRTPFEDVRDALKRLESPEPDFDDRLHLIGASSMMSHGVDIDRLNVMTMLGLPLTTAEFIQTTARVGRRWPGLVYVMTKIARQRDAATFRSFGSFITQGDRFIEPVPVTRRSRRVLERTMPGMELARVLAVHEPASRRSLATVKALRGHFVEAGITAETELAELVAGLRFTEPLDARLARDLELWLESFFHTLFEPTGDVRFPRDLSPGDRRPMISLRDVEEQAPVKGTLA